MVPVVATAGGTSPWPERPCCAGREKGSVAVSLVAIVWPCPLAVDAYAEAGRDLGFPRPARGGDVAGADFEAEGAEPSWA